jgi:hypothetical protein
MPNDMSWIEDLLPYEAQAALDSLAADKTPLTIEEALEVRKLRLALQAKVNDGR